MKRFNLTLPNHDYQKVADLAERRDRTATSIIRSFINLGLLLTDSSVERVSVQYVGRPESVEIKFLL